MGLVANARGLGIRVAAEDFEECGTMILGEQETHKLVGDLWELSGVPLGWDQDAVAQVLLDANWAANVVTHFVRGRSRTWILRFAKDQQPDRNLLQAEEEGCLMSIQKVRAPVPKQPTNSWTWKGQTGTSANPVAQTGHKQGPKTTSRWAQGPPANIAAGAQSQAAPTQMDTQTQGSQQLNPLEAFAQCLAGIQTQLAALNERQEKAERWQHSTDNAVRSLKLALEPEETADWDADAIDVEGEARSRESRGRSRSR